MKISDLPTGSPATIAALRDVLALDPLTDRVTALEAGGTGGTGGSGGTANANTALPLITGTAQQGQVLTATLGTWTNSPALTRQWKANGIPISGETGSTLLLALAQVGKTITITISADYPTGSDLTATSAATAAVIAAPDEGSESNITAPTISGTPQVGLTLTVNPGTWTGSPTLTRQWKRNGVSIGGATGDAFPLTLTDLDAVMSCTITAAYSGSPNLSATTSGTAPVAAAPVTAADVFVDSTKADDSGNGLSAATAKKTIAAAVPLLSAGQRLSLARGSYWREQITPVIDMTIEVHGAGAMPIIDGADVATGWTRTDPSTFPYRWTLNWNRVGPITGNDDLGLWDNGVRPRQADTFADLAANGGWFVTGGNYRQYDSEVHIHVGDGTDPNTNGHTYEITKRNNGIRWHPSVSESTAVVNLVGPIEVKRCSNHYNAIAGGRGTSRQMWCRDGHIHHMVTCATKSTECVCTEMRPKLEIPGVPFTAFRPDGLGFEHEFDMCSVLFPGGASRIPDSQAFLAHASLGDTLIDKLTLTACIVRGMDGIGCSAHTQIVRDSYFEDPNGYAIDMNGYTTTIDRCMVFDTTVSPKSGGNVQIRGSNPSGVRTVTDFAGYTMLGPAVQDETDVAGSSTYTNCSFVTAGGAGAGNSDGAFNYCVFDSHGPSLNFMGAGYTGDHNVFFSFLENDQYPMLRLASMGYPWGYEPLGYWIAATSQDNNSVYTRYADQTSGNANAFWLGTKLGTGGPEVGDFRINPTARVYGNNNVARVGTFMDGTPITAAGAQNHYDYQGRTAVAGPPTRRPVLPGTTAEIRAFINSRAGWNFYP